MSSTDQKPSTAFWAIQNASLPAYIESKCNYLAFERETIIAGLYNETIFQDRDVAGVEGCNTHCFNLIAITFITFHLKSKRERHEDHISCRRKP